MNPAEGSATASLISMLVKSTDNWKSKRSVQGCVNTAPTDQESEVSGRRSSAPPDTVPTLGAPSAPSVNGSTPSEIQLSIIVCERSSSSGGGAIHGSMNAFVNPVWSAMNSSLRFGARNDVPAVPRRRAQSVKSQLAVTRQVSSVPKNLSSETRYDRLTATSSARNMPDSIGTSNSA